MSQLPTIVVIEDDRMIRESLQEFLESEGFQVCVAENGRQGLETIQRLNGLCLVLLDLQMPVMTGEQVLDALKSESVPSIREVPVLVLTARAEGIHRPGLAGLIRKPVDLDDLLEKIQPFSA